MHVLESVHCRVSKVSRCLSERSSLMFMRLCIVYSVIPYSISDSIWLTNGSLLVGAGHQMFLFGLPKRDSRKEIETDSLFEYAARNNGPLEDYHPQMILQCLLWGTVNYLSNIFSFLFRHLTAFCHRES